MFDNYVMNDKTNTGVAAGCIYHKI